MMARSALFLENGLPNLATSLIEPHRHGLGHWRIKFCYESSEPFSMSSAQASKLAIHLHQIGEADMADEIDSAVKRAARYQSM